MKFNNTWKKVGLILASISFASVMMASITITVTIPPSTATNVLYGISPGGPLIVKQAVLTGTSNNTSVTVYDAPTNTFSYTNASFVSVITYPTNVISTWTNFFGYTNTVTNVALVDVPITNAVTTNTYPQKIALSASAGNSTIQNNMSTYFESGVWATNTATNTGVLTITFIQ